MTKRDVLAIAFRVLGVLEFIQLLTMIPLAIWQSTQLYPEKTALGQFNVKLYFATYIVFLIILFLIALALIFRADKIAARIMPSDAQISPLSITGTERTVFSLGTRIIAVYLLAINIPDLGNVIARFYESITQAAPLFSFIRLQSTLETFIAIALGLYLLFAAKQVVGWVYGREDQPVDNKSGS